jgi:hypothetical protein
MSNKVNRLNHLTILILVTVVIAIVFSLTPSNMVTDVYAETVDNSFLLSQGTLIGEHHFGMVLKELFGGNAKLDILGGNIDEYIIAQLNNIDQRDAIVSGTASIHLFGTYNPITGITGEYRLLEEGTFTQEDKQVPFEISCNSNFSGPGQLTQGANIIINFQEGKATLKLASLPIPTQLDTFNIQFFVAKKIDTQRKVASIFAMSREVEYLAPGSSDFQLAKRDMPLVEGTKITTRENSTCIIAFEDGSTMTMQPDTEILIIGDDKKDRSVIKTLAGNILVNIKKIANGEPIETRTQLATIGTKGTKYVCEVTEEETIVKVIEGTVSVDSLVNHQNSLVGTGNYITASATGITPPEAFNIQQEQAHWDSISTATTQNSGTGVSSGKNAMTITIGTLVITINIPSFSCQGPISIKTK